MRDIQSTDATPARFCFAEGYASGIDAAVKLPDENPVDARRRDLGQWLRRVSTGDQSALKAVYDRTSAKLYGICLRVLGDEAESQDVLQEVFVTVWRKASQFEESRASAMTWLGVIARNKAIDRLRARGRPTATLDAADHIADEGPSALDVIEQAQDRARLSDCLETLDERARTAIRAAFFEGLTYGDLADRDKVPVGTMKSWIRRGLLRLRGCLEQ